MKKKLLTSVAAFFLLLASSMHVRSTEPTQASTVYASGQADFQLALRQSMDTLSHRRFVLEGKRIVLTPIRKYIVVSFLNIEPQYGGQAHVVYDVELGRVVHIKREQ